MYLNEFINYLREEGRSERTISIYVSTVNELAKWYEETNGEPFVPEQITSLDLHNWRSYLETVKKQTPATVNKKIASLKTYWSFLIETERTNVDPTRKVKMKTLQTSTMAPKWLSRREAQRLLHAIENNEKNEWKRTRNIAITQVMLQAGLRISEVVNLNLDDISLTPKNETLTVRHGKGDKFRIVPINKDLKIALSHWLEIRQLPNRTIKDPQAVFLSERMSRITDRAIRYFFTAYFQMAIIPNGSPHNLRHTCAKRLIDQGNPIQYVARIMGHENIQTTERYTFPSEKDLRKAVKSISEEK